MFHHLKSSRTPKSHTDERRSSTASTSSSASNWTSSSLHTGGDHQSALAESSSSISDTVSEDVNFDTGYHNTHTNSYYHAMMAAQTLGSHGEQKQLYEFHQRKLEDRNESRRQSSASERSCERLTVGDCKQLWKCMIELQERYGCYHSTRIDLAVEAGEAGLLNYMRESPSPSSDLHTAKTWCK